MYANNKSVLLSVKNLTCEYQANPVGITTVTPRFSWQVLALKRNTVQITYNILVATSPMLLKNNIADVWESKTVKTSVNTFVIYHGKKLLSHDRYYWKVMVTDNYGNKSPWSDVAEWTMGILDESEWKAKWINDGLKRNTLVRDTIKWGRTINKYHRSFLPVAYMRKSIAITKPVKHAWAYVSAFGLYEVSINGLRCGTDYFTPGWSQYDKRVFYQTYDVTKLLQKNENTLSAIVGDGWYVQRHNGDTLKFLMQLHIEYQDGTTKVFGTDDTWKVSNNTPLIKTDIFDGETYDSGKEIENWNTNGFNDTNWKHAKESNAVDVIKTAYYGEPIRKQQEIKPVSVNELGNGDLLFNFGQNFAGWARLTLKRKITSSIQLQYAEALTPSGEVFTKNLRSAKNHDSYIPKGLDGEEWEPLFTYRGFQYVQVKGCKKEDIELTGIVLHSDVKRTGYFECGDSMINKLYQSILWSQRSNFFEVPTDCPQRDERMGWTGDMQVFQKTGIYNMNIGAFTARWLTSLNDGQSSKGGYADFAPLHDLYGTAGWADAGIICPLMQYKMYGDKQLLQTWYNNMVKYIDLTYNQSKNYIRDPSCWPGDWLNVNAPLSESIVTNMYFGYSVKLMAEIAAILNKKEDAEKYTALFNNIKQAFTKKFINANGTIEGNTQTSYTLSMAFDLVDSSKRAVTFAKLIEQIAARDYHISTGFLGVKHFFEVLSENGRSDIAYRVLKQQTYPGWLFNITQGANTIWESWNTWKPGEGWQDFSLNHFNFGAVGEWLYSNVAGIQPQEAGFKKI
jgi:alpha-L-rhamnosidase